MSSLHRWLVMAFVLTLSAGVLRAATVELNDGTKFTGTVTEDEAGNVTIKMKKGSISFKKDEIKSISKDDAATVTPAGPAELPKPEPAPKAEVKAQPEPKPEGKVQPKPEPAPPVVAKSKPTEPEPAPPVTPGAGTNAGLSGRNAHDDNEPRDILVLKGGGEQRGFLVAETETEIVFDCIMSGRNVSKTITSRTTFQRTEIESIKKLTDEQRAA